MRALVFRFLRDETGATAIEYAIIASMIALVIVGAVTALGTNLRGTYNNISNGVK
jgi:pilus assembly protein Flp/PilA